MKLDGFEEFEEATKLQAAANGDDEDDQDEDDESMARPA